MRFLPQGSRQKGKRRLSYFDNVGPARHGGEVGQGPRVRLIRPLIHKNTSDEAERARFTGGLPRVSVANRVETNE